MAAPEVDRACRPDTETFGSSCKYSYNGLRDYVAKGSFGVVYKAQVTESAIFSGNEIIAVKCVHLHKEAPFVANNESWTVIRSWWKKMLNLKHNHLLAYYKATIVRAPGGFSIEFMMDYYGEGDLAALLSSGKKTAGRQPHFDQEEVICFAVQLADGLTFLHQQCVIHGDLKPSNILVKCVDKLHRRLVIGDLDDTVQMHYSVTIAGDIRYARGTPRYMSPEMVKMWLTQVNDENIGRKTDIWSFGCIILDLANHSIGNKEKHLCKGREVQMTCEISDYQFAELMNEGWTPFVADSVPVSVAACIQECLRTDHTCRISAHRFLEMIRDIAMELFGSSDVGEPVPKGCFCRFA